jgi:hypothetical protein
MQTIQPVDDHTDLLGVVDGLLQEMGPASTAAARAESALRRTRPVHRLYPPVRDDVQGAQAPSVIRRG